MKCVVNRMMRSWRRALSALHILRRDSGSTPVVGSSSTQKRGSPSSAMQMLRRRCCPPLREEAVWSSAFVRFSSSSRLLIYCAHTSIVQMQAITKQEKYGKLNNSFTTWYCTRTKILLYLYYYTFVRNTFNTRYNNNEIIIR